MGLLHWAPCQAAFLALPAKGTIQGSQCFFLWLHSKVKGFFLISAPESMAPRSKAEGSKLPLETSCLQRHTNFSERVET